MFNIYIVEYYCYRQVAVGECDTTRVLTDRKSFGIF